MTKKQITHMPDLSKISLDEFKNNLKTGRLLPSRRPLLKEIDEKFYKLEKAGLNNAEILRNKLKSGSKIKSLAEETDISEPYLKLLLALLILKLYSPMSAILIVAKILKMILNFQKKKLNG